MTTVTIWLPGESAQRMGLETIPDGQYTMSVVELAGRCTQALGTQDDINRVEKDCRTWLLASAAAQAATSRVNACSLALATGFYFEETPPDIALELWFRCLFWTYFDRRYSLESSFPASEDIAGWVRVLGLPDYAGLAMLKDKQAPVDAEFGRLFDATLALYKWFAMPPVEAESEPDELPIPETAGESQ